MPYSKCHIRVYDLNMLNTGLIKTNTNSINVRREECIYADGTKNSRRRRNANRGEASSSWSSSSSIDVIDVVKLCTYVRARAVVVDAARCRLLVRIAFAWREAQIIVDNIHHFPCKSLLFVPGWMCARIVCL